MIATFLSVRTQISKQNIVAENGPRMTQITELSCFE